MPPVDAARETLPAPAAAAATPILAAAAPPSPLLRHPLLVVVGAIVVFGGLWLLVSVREVLFIGFLSVLLAIAFSYPVALFERFMPRGLAVVLTLILFFGGIAAMGFVSIPTLSSQGGQLKQKLPDAAARVQDWLQRLRVTSGDDDARQQASEFARSMLSKSLLAAVGVVSGLSALVVLIFLAAFFVLAPGSHIAGLRALVPKPNEPVFDETVTRLGTSLRQWLGGILVSMTLMGALTAIGLAAVGIDGWAVLGLITFFATFVPWVGALTAAIPALLLGLAQSPRHFLYALIVYVGVHVVEGYIVEPIVMRQAVRLRPGYLLLWQSLMGVAFGIPGIVVATPLFVCIKVLVDYLYIERRLGKRAEI
jgi:predicted PurR-regulated permease PerM